MSFTVIRVIDYHKPSSTSSGKNTQISHTSKLRRFQISWFHALGFYLRKFWSLPSHLRSSQATRSRLQPRSQECQMWCQIACEAVNLTNSDALPTNPFWMTEPAEPAEPELQVLNKVQFDGIIVGSSNILGDRLKIVDKFASTFPAVKQCWLTCNGASHQVRVCNL